MPAGISKTGNAKDTEETFRNAPAHFAPALRRRLALGELETFTSPGASVFFTFDFAGITGEEPGFFQRRPEFGIGYDQGSGNTQPERSGLAGQSAAQNGGFDIESLKIISEDQWLMHDHISGFSSEVGAEFFTVDGDTAFASLNPDFGGRFFSSACCVISIFH